MKAIPIHETGEPEVLRYDEVPQPEPGEGEIRVKIAAAGVNFIDIYHRTGLYSLPLPATPGLEAAEAHRLLAGRQTTGKLLLVP